MELAGVNDFDCESAVEKRQTLQTVSGPINAEMVVSPSSCCVSILLNVFPKVAVLHMIT